MGGPNFCGSWQCWRGEQSITDIRQTWVSVVRGTENIPYPVRIPLTLLLLFYCGGAGEVALFRTLKNSGHTCFLGFLWRA